MPLHDEALGRLALTDYRGFVPVVAKAYLARPDFEDAAVASWVALRKHVDQMFKQMSSRVNVVFTDKDPYPDFKAMQHDIKTNNRMLVWTGASEHGVWTPEQNWRFRAVHDYIVHLAGEHPFTLRGEMAAYNRHVKIAPVLARPALFTEIVGQTCTFMFLGGAFGPQKICNLYGFDYVNVGIWDPELYVENFTDPSLPA